MRWTWKRPRIQGWYWYQSRPDRKPVVVQLGPYGNGQVRLVSRQEQGLYASADSMNGKWAGPIPEPID